MVTSQGLFAGNLANRHLCLEGSVAHLRRTFCCVVQNMLMEVIHVLCDIPHEHVLFTRCIMKHVHVVVEHFVEKQFMCSQLCFNQVLSKSIHLFTLSVTHA